MTTLKYDVIIERAKKERSKVINGILISLGKKAKSIFNFFSVNMYNRRMINDLSLLTDTQLNDIGVLRGDIINYDNKCFS